MILLIIKCSREPLKSINIGFTNFHIYWYVVALLDLYTCTYSLVGPHMRPCLLLLLLQTREQYLAELLSLIKFHLFSSEELDNIPDALLSYEGVQESVQQARQLWLHPNRYGLSIVEFCVDTKVDLCSDMHVKYY